MTTTFYKCTNCGEENHYVGDDIRQGCYCSPAYLVPKKKSKCLEAL